MKNRLISIETNVAQLQYKLDNFSLNILNLNCIKCFLLVACGQLSASK